MRKLRHRKFVEKWSREKKAKAQSGNPCPSLTSWGTRGSHSASLGLGSSSAKSGPDHVSAFFQLTPAIPSVQLHQG